MVTTEWWWVLIGQQKQNERLQALGFFFFVEVDGIKKSIDHLKVDLVIFFLALTFFLICGLLKLTKLSLW